MMCSTLDPLPLYVDVLSPECHFRTNKFVRYNILPELEVPLRSWPQQQDQLSYQEPCEPLPQWIHYNARSALQHPWDFLVITAPMQGGAGRWTGLFHKIYDIQLRIAYPAPEAEQTPDCLDRMIMYTAIDGFGPLNPPPSTTYPYYHTSTRWGSCWSRQRPQGLAISPWTRCQILDLILKEVSSVHVNHYAEDMLVPSPGRNLQNHLNTLERLFKA